MKNKPLSSRAIALALLGLLTASTVQAAGARKPNFIVFFTDDQGYADAGVFGATKFETPNIDKMAGQGMVFRDFYAQAVCGPSRSALLTGCYPIRLAEVDNKKSPHTAPAPEVEPTMAQILQKAGYATAAIGKWHQTRGTFRDRSKPDLGYPADQMPIAREPGSGNHFQI